MTNILNLLLALFKEDEPDTDEDKPDTKLPKYPECFKKVSEVNPRYIAVSNAWGWPESAMR